MAAAMGAGLLLAAEVREAGADVYTRRNAKGVLEATNLRSAAGEGYTLAYRSKGVVRHSLQFLEGRVDAGRFDPLIREAAEREGVSAELVRAVIRQESAFDPYAVSSAGARGLMQLMPDTARRFGVSNVFEARDNIAGGVRYLRVLLRLFRNDVSLALAAYNAGEGAVMRHGGIPPYRETREYVRKITAALQIAPNPAASAGMMSFTPGGGMAGGADGPSKQPAATTATAAAPAPTGKVRATAPRPRLYRWRDERGVTHVAETPPGPGVAYETLS